MCSYQRQALANLLLAFLLVNLLLTNQSNQVFFKTLYQAALDFE